MSEQPPESPASLSDEELAARTGAPVRVAVALRSARTLAEARAYAAAIVDPGPLPAPPPEAYPTLLRFAELRVGAPADLDAEGARTIVRELQAVKADLRALRRALTGQERGPELWAVVAAIPRDEALARVGATLA